MTNENPGPIRFGVNFLPNSVQDTLSWAKCAEEVGCEFVGVSDSQSLYRDVYMCLAAVAANTEKVTIGPRVINPITRHPAVAANAAATLEEMIPGRTMLGIGTGDSSVLNLGLKPATRARLKAYVTTLKELLETGNSIWQGRPVRMTWQEPKKIPIYFGASGPKMLHMAGELADGVIVNTGLTPEVVQDSIARVRAGAESVGRSIDDIDMWWFPLTNVNADREAAIDEIGMSLASAGSHLSFHSIEGKHIPEELHAKVIELGKRYRHDEHDKPDGGNGALIKELDLVDYLAERYSISGTVDDCIEKINKAAAAGARQIWMSIHFDDKVRILRDWSDVMAGFR